jgi:hypothetical protein
MPMPKAQANNTRININENILLPLFLLTAASMGRS